MTIVKYEIEINAPIEQVYEYYTNPDNIKKHGHRILLRNHIHFQIRKMKKALK